MKMQHGSTSRGSMFVHRLLHCSGKKKINVKPMKVTKSLLQGTIYIVSIFAITLELAWLNERKDRNDLIAMNYYLNDYDFKLNSALTGEVTISVQSDFIKSRGFTVKANHNSITFYGDLENFCNMMAATNATPQKQSANCDSINSIKIRR